MKEATIQTVSVHDLKKKQEAENAIYLIDVREANEWQEMRIKGAIHIPKDTISETIDSKVPDRNTPVYLHCRSGVRSQFAAQHLINLGYQYVYSVEGGIMAWMSQGFPVIKG